jgi:hypothetical protein
MVRNLVCILAIFTPSALGQVPLRWQWSEGDRHDYRLDERMHQTVSGPIQSELRWRREVGFSDRVLSNAEGLATIERVFGWVRVSLERDGEAPMVRDTRDTARPANPETAFMLEPFAALAGRSIVFTVDGDGAVASVRGSPEAIDAMLSPFAGGAMQGLLDAFGARTDRESRLALQLEQALKLIPGRDSRVGDRWAIDIDHLNPLGVPLKSALNAELAAVENARGIARITINGRVEAGEATGILPVRLDRGEVTGSLRFDTGRGVIERSEMTMTTDWSVDAGPLTGDESIRQNLRQSAVLERVEEDAP